MNSANNESKQSKLSMKRFVNFLILYIHGDPWLVFYPLAQEELDCMYSTANKNKKSPCHPNQKFTDIECSTAAGINTNTHLRV